MLRVGFHVEVICLDGSIGDKVEFNIYLFLSLPQHAWGLSSDDASLLNSVVKSSDTGTIQAYASNVPRTPERKKLIYTDAKDRPSNDTEDPRGVKA